MGSGENRKDKYKKIGSKEVWESGTCVDPQEWTQGVKGFVPRVSVRGEHSSLKRY